MSILSTSHSIAIASEKYCMTGAHLWIATIWPDDLGKMAKMYSILWVPFITISLFESGLLESIPFW